MPILRNARHAIIDERKLMAYVLNPAHPRGRDKARLFKSALGYDRANCADLIEEIRRAILCHGAIFVRQDRYGRQYRADLTLKGPRGRLGSEPDGSMIEAAMSQGSLRRSSSAAPGRRSAEGFALFDVVRVREAVPEHHLAGGEEGTIVEVLDRPERAYLVDFSGGSAEAVARACPWSP